MMSTKVLVLALLCFTSALGGRVEKRDALFYTALVTLDESLCHPEPNAEHAQYIVGYGDLIGEENKNKFYEEAGESIPVRVAGFGRHWNFQKPNIGFGTTLLGGAVDPSATFNGVAFTIPAGDNVTATLLGHDERQASFCRQKVPHVSLNALGKENKTLEEGDYWIYLTRSEYTAFPNQVYPVVQSNVDIFITGCLDIAKKYEIPSFADECVQSTLGWQFSWVNDRVHPRRPFVNQPRAGEIDTLLATNVPAAFNQITIE